MINSIINKSTCHIYVQKKGCTAVYKRSDIQILFEGATYTNMEHIISKLQDYLRSFFYLIKDIFRYPYPLLN